MRRCWVEGANAVLRRRGAAEAGAIFVKIDRLDGCAALYGPAPRIVARAPGQGVDRTFARMHEPEWIGSDEADKRLEREIAYDPDLWIVDVEKKDVQVWLDLAR